MEAMSSTFTKSMSRSMPSTSTSGVFDEPKVLIPRIQNVEPAPGSPERWIDTTPANCPAILPESLATGALRSSTATDEIAPTTLAFFCTP